MIKHQEILEKKSKLSQKEFKLLLQLILKNVIIISEDILNIHKEEAKYIVKDIDINDTLFIACCLAFPGSILWSDDKKLKRQERIKIINTQEFIYMCQFQK